MCVSERTHQSYALTSTCCAQPQLALLAQHVRSKFVAAGLDLADRRPFTPHITIAKLSKMSSPSPRSIPRKAYADAATFSNVAFSLGTLELCSMVAPRPPGSYYFVETEFAVRGSPNSATSVAAGASSAVPLRTARPPNPAAIAGVKRALSDQIPDEQTLRELHRSAFLSHTSLDGTEQSVVSEPHEDQTNLAAGSESTGAVPPAAGEQPLSETDGASVFDQIGSSHVAASVSVDLETLSTMDTSTVAAGASADDVLSAAAHASLEPTLAVTAVESLLPPTEAVVDSQPDTADMVARIAVGSAAVAESPVLTEAALSTSESTALPTEERLSAWISSTLTQADTEPDGDRVVTDSQCASGSPALAAAASAPAAVEQAPAATAVDVEETPASTGLVEQSGRSRERNRGRNWRRGRARDRPGSAASPLVEAVHVPAEPHAQGAAAAVELRGDGGDAGRVGRRGGGGGGNGGGRGGGRGGRRGGGRGGRGGSGHAQGGASADGAVARATVIASASTNAQ
jgi:hypothetical protein